MALKEGTSFAPSEYDYITNQGTLHDEWTFLAAPGTHTYTFEASSSPAGVNLLSQVLTATLVPFNGVGASPLVGEAHAAPAAGANQP
jgi:hypothetical protein